MEKSEKNMNGIFVSQILYQNLRDFLANKESLPNMVDISLGDDFGGLMYAKMKKKKIEAETGMGFQSVHFDHIGLCQLKEYIKKLNEDPTINGIMLQLPLTKELRAYEREVLDSIDPSKDVDGLTSLSVGLLNTNQSCLTSCTALGIETLLKCYNVTLDGSLVGIINRSSVVGKPLASILLKDNATPIICHSHTPSLEDITSQCDIVVAALNKKEKINSKYIKPGAVVIDVGVHKNEIGKTVGDVLYDDVVDKVSLITPATGAVGPMTICMLAYNTAKSCYGEDVDKVLSSGIDDVKQLLKKRK